MWVELLPITVNLLAPMLVRAYDRPMVIFFAYLGLFYLLFAGGNTESLVYNVFHLVASMLVYYVLSPLSGGKGKLHLGMLAAAAILCELVPLGQVWRGVEMLIIGANWLAMGYLYEHEHVGDAAKSMINYMHLLLMLRFAFDPKLFTLLYMIYPLGLCIVMDYKIKKKK